MVNAVVATLAMHRYVFHRICRTILPKMFSYQTGHIAVAEKVVLVL
jgi:hypothetical protein